MPKIQESKGRFSITIPYDMIAQSGMVKGDVVSVSYNERGNLEIKKVNKKVV